MDEAGLRPGGSFLLGFLTFCILFALQAAEKSSGWWDCWETLETKYWSFSFNINPSNEYSVLISFRID